MEQPIFFIASHFKVKLKVYLALICKQRGNESVEFRSLPEGILLQLKLNSRNQWSNYNQMQ